MEDRIKEPIHMRGGDDLAGTRLEGGVIMGHHPPYWILSLAGVKVPQPNPKPKPKPKPKLSREIR